jgi:hypothetical protein
LAITSAAEIPFSLGTSGVDATAVCFVLQDANAIINNNGIIRFRVGKLMVICAIAFL